MSAERRKAAIEAMLRSDPRTFWPRFFQRHGNRITESTVRILLQTLVRHKAYGHAVELLRTAIREGKAKPWMYEALAMVLRLAGHPDREVEEALLSAADSISDSPLSLYRVAEQLAKFGHHRAALNLLRRAAALAPDVAQPYEKALVLALQLDDPDALEWAATNLLSRAWREDHFRLHRLAYAAVEEMVRKLERNGDLERATQLRMAVREADQRDLVIRVTWQGEADVDVRVLEPIGTECSIRNRRTAAGGVLVQDGMGQRPEEIYICPRAFPGVYQVFCKKVWGNVLGNRVRIEVTRWQGTEAEQTEVHYAIVDQQEPVLVKLPRGRRSELANVPHIQLEMDPHTGRWATHLVMPLAKLDRFLKRYGGRYRGARHLYQVALGSAIAYQPIPAPVFDGAGMAVSAVVSHDRRYVRIGISPFFTNVVGERRFQVFATFR